MLNIEIRFVKQKIVMYKDYLFLFYLIKGSFFSKKFKANLE